MDPKLLEEVLRRLLRRYQEKLVPDDYHRRVVDEVLEELPDIVRDAAKART